MSPWTIDDVYLVGPGETLNLGPGATVSATQHLRYQILQATYLPLTP